MQIRRVPLPSRRTFFQSVLPRMEPVVFTGAIRSWPGAGAADPASAVLAWLDRRVGHRTVTVSKAGSRTAGRLFYRGGARLERNWTDSPWTVAELVRVLREERERPSGRTVYAQSTPIPRDLGELAADLPFPLLSRRDLAGGPYLWIGNGGHRVQTHFDEHHNFHCVLAGRKRFTLFPPDELVNLYVGPLDRTPGGVPVSMVDPQAPDLERYPRFKQARRRQVQVELHAGDVLFLPAHWWHHVESVGLNAAVTWFWSEIPLEAQHAAQNAFLMGLLAIRPLPAHRRRLLQLLFQHFVFEEWGDPYAHLPARQQGVAGRPGPRNARRIRARLTAEAQRGTLFPSEQFQWQQRYQLSHELVPSRGAGGMQAKTADSREVIVPLNVVPLLTLFASPATPTEALRKASKRWQLSKQDFSRFIVPFVAQGVLRAVD